MESALPSDAAAPNIHHSNRVRVAINTLADGTREVTTRSSSLAVFWKHGEVRITFAMRGECISLPSAAEQDRRRFSLTSAIERRRRL